MALHFVKGSHAKTISKSTNWFTLRKISVGLVLHSKYKINLLIQTRNALSVLKVWQIFDTHRISDNTHQDSHTDRKPYCSEEGKYSVYYQNTPAHSQGGKMVTI